MSAFLTLTTRRFIVGFAAVTTAALAVLACPAGHQVHASARVSGSASTVVPAATPGPDNNGWQ